MKKPNRCLPIGNLPYTTNEAATKMMVKLFEDVPYLPFMPFVSNAETLVHRTFENMPGIHIKDTKIIFSKKGEMVDDLLEILDMTFNNPTEERLELFESEVAFLPKYCQILSKVKPAKTVVNLMGVFSASQTIITKDCEQFLTDKFYRKFIIQAIAVKALWFINKIKKYSPETKPIIVLEEPLLYKVGDLKRENEEITKDIIVSLISRVVSKIQEAGAEVCIQSFEKCDWQIPIEAGVNIISFDAYTNPNNLNIIPEQVNSFLANGGKINWAIIPVMDEPTVKALTIDSVYSRFIKTIEALIDSGTSEVLTYNRSSVSIQGNLDNLPIIFAEKALILTTQLAKKIPTKTL